MQGSLRTKLVHTVANTVHHYRNKHMECTVRWKVPIPSWLCGAPEHHTLRVSSPRQQPYAQNCHSDHSSGHGQDPISSITMCVVVYSTLTWVFNMCHKHVPVCTMAQNTTVWWLERITNGSSHPVKEWLVLDTDLLPLCTWAVRQNVYDGLFISACNEWVIMWGSLS